MSGYLDYDQLKEGNALDTIALMPYADLDDLQGPDWALTPVPLDPSKDPTELARSLCTTVQAPYEHIDHNTGYPTVAAGTFEIYTEGDKQMS